MLDEYRNIEEKLYEDIEELQDRPETIILVGVDCGEFDADASLNELAELARTAGAEVCGRICQKRDSPDKATCIGSGRLEELQGMCNEDGIDVVIFDRELSGTQLRNLEQRLDCRVIDRTMLILDIFALRARSAEGRLQVELAQMQYRLPRLSGQGISMSRLGGGIGTRGPGETKLESDRRHIRRHIHTLRQNLNEVERRRSFRHERRKKDGVVTVALVGYTNAGKSTLMNTLTGAGVLAENKLFATLDPTARALKLPDGRNVMLIDTVGFISRLPHYLVDAFRSTLEEAAGADVVLNICDASSPESELHFEVSEKLLAELGCGKENRVIKVYNKCDLVDTWTLSDHEPGSGKYEICRISAMTGEGIPELLSCIAAALPPDRMRVSLLLPFSRGALAEQCRREGIVENEAYTDKGLSMTATLSMRLLSKVKEYIIE